MRGSRAKAIRKAVLQHPQIIDMGAQAFVINYNRYAKKVKRSRRMENGETSEVEGQQEIPAFTSPFRQLCRQYKRLHRKKAQARILPRAERIVQRVMMAMEADPK